jgi:hypothetical protein
VPTLVEWDNNIPALECWWPKRGAPTAFSERSVASLREIQRSFAAALRDPAVTCAVLPPANSACIATTARITFREALGQYLSGVAPARGRRLLPAARTHYRERFPSRSGDLHWAGATSPRSSTTTSRQRVPVAGRSRARRVGLRAKFGGSGAGLAGVDSLAGYSSVALERLAFGLQPSLRTLSSSFPVFSVWLTNQVDNAPPVDQSQGSEQGMIRIRHDSVEVRKLDRARLLLHLRPRPGRNARRSHDRRRPRRRALTNVLAFLSPKAWSVRSR